VAWLEVNPDPSERDLRIFGWLLAAFFVVWGGIVRVRTGSTLIAGGVWAGGLGVSLAYFAVPALRWPLYTLWMRAVYPIGWIVSHFALAVIFYGVLTPTGLVLRLFGRDPLHLRFDPRERSYWTRIPPQERSRYFRQS
jgi:hypothetical protein